MFEFEFVDRYGVEYGATEEEVQEKKEKLQLHLWDLMRSFPEYPDQIQVTYYPYRKAQVYDFTFVAERDSLYGLECLLAMKGGARHIDNHVVYGVTRYGITEYYWFEDDLVFCGKKISNRI